jgi:hypothetical protein
MMMSEPFGDPRCCDCLKTEWDGECDNKIFHEEQMFTKDTHLLDSPVNEMFSESLDEDIKMYHAVHKELAMYLVFYAKSDDEARTQLPTLVKVPNEWYVTEVKTETFMG